MDGESGIEVVTVGLVSALACAVVAGVGHTLLLAWLTRQLLRGRRVRLASPVPLALLLLAPRLALALLSIVALWLGGIGAGLGALAGYWLGRTTMLLTSWRLMLE